MKLVTEWRVRVSTFLVDGGRAHPNSGAPRFGRRLSGDSRTFGGATREPLALEGILRLPVGMLKRFVPLERTGKCQSRGQF